MVGARLVLLMASVAILAGCAGMERREGARFHRWALEKTTIGAKSQADADALDEDWEIFRTLVRHEWLASAQDGKSYRVTYDVSKARPFVVEVWTDLVTGNREKVCAIAVFPPDIRRRCADLDYYEWGKFDQDRITFFDHMKKTGMHMRLSEGDIVAFTGSTTIVDQNWSDHASRLTWKSLVVPKSFLYLRPLQPGERESLDSKTVSVEELLPSPSEQTERVASLWMEEQLAIAEAQQKRRQITADGEEAFAASMGVNKTVNVTNVADGPELTKAFAQGEAFIAELRAEAERSEGTNAGELFETDDRLFTSTAPSSSGGEAASESSATQLAFGPWLYLQSDMLVQSRMALVRKEGAMHEMAIEFRVLRKNEHGQMACLSSCNGFIVSFSHFQREEVIHFAPSFTEPKVYRLPWNLKVDATAAKARWNDQEKRLVSLSTGELLRVYFAQVDTVAIGQTSRFRYDFDWAKRVVVK